MELLALFQVRSAPSPGLVDGRKHFDRRDKLEVRQRANLNPCQVDVCRLGSDNLHQLRFQHSRSGPVTLHARSGVFLRQASDQYIGAEGNRRIELRGDYLDPFIDSCDISIREPRPELIA